jgi:flavin reductase (DIM6/NTAB) family NADH-FMN oxidoreductase RutF
MKRIFKKINSLHFSKSVFLLLMIVVLSVMIKIYEIPQNFKSEKSTNNTAEIIQSYSKNEASFPTVSDSERLEIISEVPLYNSRNIEQTYLTMAEWYMVYSFNEFGDFVQSGGKQTDFPFLMSVKNFWSYYRLSLQKSSEEDFNWQYNFVTWVIGVNFTFEYLVKSFYENTLGSITQFISGSDGEVDAYIANSWHTYAERMYQITWYHYPYFDDLIGIWVKTPLFNKDFVRNIERKTSFSISYLLKGTYAKVWLLIAAQKENQTFSIVHTNNRGFLEDDRINIVKVLSDDLYVIETERYAGFKEALLTLTARGVKFIEIQGHDIITLSYLSHTTSESFSEDDDITVLDNRELFFEPHDYTNRVMLEVPVKDLEGVIGAIQMNGGTFEMIYDF